VRSPHYWWLSAGGALALGAQVGFLAHQIPMLAKDLGTGGAAMAVSATALSAAVGRLLAGYLSSRMALNKLAAACYVIQALGFMVLLAAENVFTLYLASIVAGFVVGAIVLLPPMLVRRAFGSSDYGRTFASVSIMLYVGAGAGPWVTGILKDWSGDYELSIWLLAALHLGAIILFLASPLRRLGRLPG
jgi:MFS family permease